MPLFQSSTASCPIPAQAEGYATAVRPDMSPKQRVCQFGWKPNRLPKHMVVPIWAGLTCHPSHRLCQCGQSHPDQKVKPVCLGLFELKAVPIQRMHTPPTQVHCTGRAGQGRAGQGRAGQGRAGQARVGEARARRAGQGRPGQDQVHSYLA